MFSHHKPHPCCTPKGVVRHRLERFGDVLLVSHARFLQQGGGRLGGDGDCFNADAVLSDKGDLYV
jgi:hypothetical protein